MFAAVFVGGLGVGVGDGRGGGEDGVWQPGFLGRVVGSA